MSMSASSSIRSGCGSARTTCFAWRRSKALCRNAPCAASPRFNPPKGWIGRKTCRVRRGFSCSPEKVEAVAELPDHPPRLFIWRNVRHRVAKADGPERIHGEWWRERQRNATCPRLLPRRDNRRRALLAVSATRRRSKAAAGGCTAWVKHELRRSPGHDAFLVPARRIVGRRIVLGGGAAWHQGARRRRSQLTGRHRARARSRQGHGRPPHRRLPPRSCNAAPRCWSIRPTARPMAGFAVC